VDTAESAGEEADEERLAEKGEEDDGGDTSGVVDGEGGVEQHADADEEEEAEEIADGHDVAEGLRASTFGARDKQAPWRVRPFGDCSIPIGAGTTQHICLLETRTSTQRRRWRAPSSGDCVMK
jgi:hypothetical protein